jgi:hypothetical protein
MLRINLVKPMSIDSFIGITFSNIVFKRSFVHEYGSEERTIREIALKIGLYYKTFIIKYFTEIK